MQEALNSERLAALVSTVTDTMCDITFSPWDPLARGESLSGRMVLLPIEGKRKINIVLGYDGKGGRMLAAKLFRSAPETIKPELVDDAVRELLNMVAGQVVRDLKIEQILGLPRPTSMAEIAKEGGPDATDAVLLRSEGNADLRLWIFETVDHDGGLTRVPMAKRVKILVKRFVNGA